MTTPIYPLFQRNIGVVYQKNTASRLYGITFIDHNTSIVLNGSRLDKKYSANAIVDRLESPRQYKHLTATTQTQGSSLFASQQLPHSTQGAQPIPNTEQRLESSEIGNSIGSLFDIPILPNGTEEEMFHQKMQRQKKKGRRM